MNKKFIYLTKMSLGKKIKTKWFLIANLFFLILIVGIANIDNIIKFFGGEFNEKREVLVIDYANSFDSFKDGYEKSSRYLADISDAAIVTNYQNGYDEAIKEISDKKSKLLLIIDRDEDNYLKAKIVSKEAIGTLTNTIISTVLNSIRSEMVLKDYNITREEFDRIEQPVSVSSEVISDKNMEDDMMVSVIMEFITLPLFMLIMFLIQMIGAEVNEEKSTRSMEIIISNVSPKVHFLSKIVAANLFVFIQSVLIVVFVIVGVLSRFIISGGNILNGIDTGDIARLTSSVQIDQIISTLGVMLPVLIVMLILTFIAYSLLAGVLASMTTNLEDFQQLQTPIVVVSLVGFYLAMISGVFKGSLFIKIMGYIPLVSSMLAPTLYVLGEITIVDLLISIALLIGLIYLLIRYGLRIYKVGILNYSGVGLWKKMAKAIKEK